MKEKEILCTKCLHPIINREDLIIARDFLEINAYHLECYSKELKSFKTITLSNKPLNVRGSLLGAIIGAIIGLILLFVDGVRLLGLSLLILPTIRFYSWFIIERYFHN